MTSSDFLFQIYRAFNSRIVILLRAVILISFIFLIFLNFNAFFEARLYLFLFFVFFINEIFIYFKVNKTLPYSTVKEATMRLEDTMLFSTLTLFKSVKDGYGLMKRLKKEPEIQFLLSKIDKNFNLEKADENKEKILDTSYQVAKETQGTYITTVDLFVSYLILTEEKTRLLEKAELKESDIMNIAYWVRSKLNLDSFHPLHIHFHGEGFGEFFIYGWNYEVKKYSSDITSKVLSFNYPPMIVRRQKEYETLLSILSKKNGNNVILVGEPGLGKQSLVEYFAYNSYIRDIPQRLQRRRVFEILVERIIAGSTSQGEFEKRMDDLLTDLTHSENVLLFIQNIENIFGAGTDKLDLSGILFDYLKSGKVQIIGTSVPSSYKKYLARKETVSDLFEIIQFSEPNMRDALFMVFEKIPEIEYKYKVHFSYLAISSSIDLSSSYITDAFLPGKAIRLLEDVASTTNLSEVTFVDKKDVVKKVEEKTNIVLSNPTSSEKKILLHLEEEMHKRIIGQDEAVNAVSNAMRRLRSGFTSQKRPISVFLFLGPTGVGKTETAKALTSLYFGDEKRMIRLDMSEFQTQDSIKRLLGSLPGESYETSSFVDEVKEHPFSLVLLDEFEKAHPKILDVFLQVFDEGKLTDNSGREILFTNTIIIATSNAGSEFVREYVKSHDSTQKLKKELLEKIQHDNIYKIELLDRFDEIIIFKAFYLPEIEKIAKLILGQALKVLEEQQIFMTFDSKVIEKVAREGYEIEFGARNIRRFVASNIENLISNLILEGKLKKSGRYDLTVDDKNEFVVR